MAELLGTDIERHRQVGIMPEILTRAGVFRVSRGEEAERLGLYDFDGGVVYPYFDPRTNQRVGCRARLDSPPIGADGRPDGKYRSSYGDRRHLYFARVPAKWLDDINVPIVVVESEKSALAILCMALELGIPVVPVATGGCYGWRGKIGKKALPDGSSEDERGPLPDLDICKGRFVYVSPDTNVTTNPDVRRAMKGLFHALSEAGAKKAYVVLLPVKDGERINGPDDFIGKHGYAAYRDLLISASVEAVVRANARILETAIMAARVTPATDWPDPAPIQLELPPVEWFSEELLPDSFRPLVSDVAERMQVPVDFPAAVTVLCLAGVVNRRARIQSKANDTGFVIVPNLWGGIIAPPGFLKSPVIQAATRPLIQIQREWRHQYEEDVQGYTVAREEHELRVAAWREMFKANLKSGGKAVPNRPTDVPAEPKLRRLICNDGTFEALHKLMNENPAGVLVIRDELSGWMAELDRQGRDGDRGFFLTSWAGDSSFTLDRIGRGTVHVDACCASMLGGIQPGRLRSYLADALMDGPANDGLIQRFQVFVWPDFPKEWKYIDRAPDAEAEEAIASVFRRLVEMDADNPRHFLFAADAQELFVDWLTELESKLRGPDLHPALISHLSKYRKLMPALALLFELAAGPCESSRVSLAHAREAAAWCDYLESHARRIYSCIVTPQLRAAQELAGKLKTRKVGTDGTFTLRDVYLKCWTGLDSPESVKIAADVLVDADWIMDVTAKSGIAGGRPSNRYAVNPKLWGTV